MHTDYAPRLRAVVASALVGFLISGCSTDTVDSPPPTIPVATPAVSPPVDGAVDGVVTPRADPGTATVFDTGTSSLVVLGPADQLTVQPSTGPVRSVALPAEATALTGDGTGTVILATRGGYLRVDLDGDEVTTVPVDGQSGTDFTAVARRDDGRLVLGGADGTVYTLSSDTAVGATLKHFARVDALVTQHDSVVVLDRGQTSVTEIDADGTSAEQALRAGEGATSLAVDPAGRVLAVDTRAGALLVYGTEPLILRQRHPVRDVPYGLTGSPTLAWVSQTATNTVVGYDLATGIPVEKVRYRTVQQPDTLAFDDANDTLYVVSGSGAGVQMIEGATP